MVPVRSRARPSVLNVTTRHSPVADGGCLVRDEGPVRHIVLDRPHRRNALDRSLSLALLRAVVEASRDDAVRCIVLAGTGPSFCAGDDLDAVRALADGDAKDAPADPVTLDCYYLRICEELVRCPKPVVALVTGAALGAGAELMCAADLRLVDSSLAVGVPLMTFGQVGNLALLGRVIGYERLNELVLTGRVIGSAEAVHIGLAHEAHAPEALTTAGADLARTLAAVDPGAVTAFKTLREQVRTLPLDAALRLQDRAHVDRLLARRVPA